MSVTALESEEVTARQSAIRTTPALVLIAAVVLGGWILIAILGPLFAPDDPIALGPSVLASPGGQHFLGTDELGRDILSRVIWGARVSIPYSVLMIVLSTTVGAILGGLAGYFGGWVDEVIMRGADFVFAFPSIILAMAISAALGPDLRNAVIAIVLVSWPAYARVVRSLVLAAMQSEYVVAAKLLGRSPAKVIVSDVVPNVVGPTLVYATLGVGNAMLFLVGLSFLGLGAQPPTAEWGSMISDATSYYDRWWLALFPGLAIATFVLAVNIVGDRLRDVLDPRQGLR